MAMKWNWRRLGYGSGAVVAAISAIFALGPGDNTKPPSTFIASNLLKIVSKVNKDECEISTGLSIHAKTLPQTPVVSPDLDDASLKEAISKSRMICKRVKNELGLPGLTIGVSVNGKMVWQEGLGYAELEKNVRMKPENVLRIASISKSMTMAMLAKLMEEGKIDIDKPIQTYLPSYPEKFVDGEKVTITTRHLLSHLSGIRHYEKKKKEIPNETDKKDCNKDKRQQTSRSNDEMSLEEYFLKERFNSVDDALKMFQDDELFHKPGTKFLYTTHGWTVVSGIIEKLTDMNFQKHSKLMFDYWGLKNTYLDQHEPIIYNRASYYTRYKDGEIINAPYVDNSYKWAGGGFLSTVADLNQFAHILMYSMQTFESSGNCDKGLPKRPYLKQSTMKDMWTGNPTSKRATPDFLYALGFEVGEPLRKCVFCKERDLMTVVHTGAAIGSSSILLMAFPAIQRASEDNCSTNSFVGSESREVKGVVVSIITNMTSVSLRKTAQEVANNFRVLL